MNMKICSGAERCNSKDCVAKKPHLKYGSVCVTEENARYCDMVNGKVWCKDYNINPAWQNAYKAVQDLRDEAWTNVRSAVERGI